MCHCLWVSRVFSAGLSGTPVRQPGLCVGQGEAFSFRLGPKWTPVGREKAGPPGVWSCRLDCRVSPVYDEAWFVPQLRPVCVETLPFLG